MSEDETGIAGLKPDATNDEIKERAFELMHEIRDLCFATCDNNKPEVRIIDLMDIRGDAIYFLTARGKHFYKQLMKNPEIAISGMNKDYISVRAKGCAKKAETEVRMSVLDKNPHIKEMYGDAVSILEVFYIDAGAGEIFDLSTPKPKRLRFGFGGKEPEKSAYYISDACIECGQCQEICPEDAIEEGTPYRINECVCLECGMCSEICPEEAVKYRR
ncbi:4Fe-4S binding protein [Methanogenium marinum]|uniref:4Fe-4S binding protein n=1 Tax=Methanogenium marinum TaxID=348610 RepID=A0A9Q4PVD3_9EURY|nr:4Fe-4S binding protein [Methanogenium marinum]MDE4907464.1 4Fe-4S binding protein [Methanogenium marinum]